MSVPEPYQPYALPGQRPAYGDIELYDERDPIVLVTDPDNPNLSVRVRRSALLPATPTPPRDLTPQPLFDPIAQRLVGGGALAVGVGWGGAQLLNAIAGAGTGLLAFVLLLLLVRRRPSVSIHQEVHQHARFGKNNVTM
jgi:hypothetical protein